MKAKRTLQKVIAEISVIHKEILEGLEKLTLPGDIEAELNKYYVNHLYTLYLANLVSDCQ